MAEVAANIESKTSIEEFRVALDDKITRAELSQRMQEKVSFEDMKRYVSLQGGSNDAAKGGSDSGPATTGQMANRQFELIDEELRRLKDKVEDTFH